MKSSPITINATQCYSTTHRRVSSKRIHPYSTVPPISSINSIQFHQFQILVQMSCVNLLEPLFPFDLLSFLSERIQRSYCVRFSYKLVWKRHSYWKQNLGKFGAFLSIYRRCIWPPAHLSVGSFRCAFDRRHIWVPAHSGASWPLAHLGAGSFGCAFDRRLI